MTGALRENVIREAGLELPGKTHGISVFTAFTHSTRVC